MALAYAGRKTTAINDGGSSSNMAKKYAVEMQKKRSSQKNTGSTSSKSTGSKTQTANTGLDMNAYLALLNGLAGKQKSQAASYYDAGNSAAQQAYDRNMAALEASYNKQMGALSDNYNSTVAALNRQNDASKTEVNTDADRALREAYINKMLSGRNLNQQLSAQGLSGGATETTMASMQNNYGNARNDIETTRADNLTKLYNTLQDNLASALQAYNTQKANAENSRFQMQMQIENALANALADNYTAQMSALGNIDSSYTDLLSSLVKNQGNFSYDKAAANNPVAVITSLMQGSGDSLASNYAKYLQQQQLQNTAQNAANTITQNIPVSSLLGYLT